MYCVKTDVFKIRLTGAAYISCHGHVGEVGNDHPVVIVAVCRQLR